MDLNELNSHLKDFKSIPLDVLDKNNLLNRFDTKFVVSPKNLKRIFEILIEEYSILEINNRRIFRYKNLYFDTDDFLFYFQHHNGKTDRLKIRFRQYSSNESCFFEIKQKHNNYTTKERLPVDSNVFELNDGTSKMVENSIGLNPDILSPKIWVFYDRITLLHKQLPEKITIDTNINFKTIDELKKFPEIAILEVKHKRLNNYSDTIHNIERNNLIKKVNFSKYCMGIIASDYPVKYNRFKPKLINIFKVANTNYGF
ncbi:MAG: polyphosphate polymerase domain-containing protein [Candidatus Kapabacteria bacterium]|nr:polyphosphate polymerase domain-containing protein [Candidatus Kapabacteria bacterium]